MNKFPKCFGTIGYNISKKSVRIWEREKMYRIVTSFVTFS